MREEAKKKNKRILKGIVVSNKMDKTIVVLVEDSKQHPRYKKRYRVFKKYKAHDPNNQHKVGDKVAICESRPLSRDKRWTVVEIKNKKEKIKNTDQK